MSATSGGRTTDAGALAIPAAMTGVLDIIPETQVAIATAALLKLDLCIGYTPYCIS